MDTIVRVRETEGVLRKGAPVEIGLPLPPGAADAGTSWAVLDEGGGRLPSQFKPLAQYADGGLRAVHGVFLADLASGEERVFIVAPREAATPVPLCAADARWLAR